MEIKPNREFVLRHLGVALLMAGLTGWFVYDGAVTYPALSDADFRERILHGADGPDFARKRRDATVRQFQFAGFTGLAALMIAFGVWRVRRQTLVWNDTEMCGTLTLGRPLAFADIVARDDSKWAAKGIMALKARDGRCVTLDAWHHTGVKELVAKIVPAEPA